MLELPESLTMAQEISKDITNRTVEAVLPPSKEHKFCWYNGDPVNYDGYIKNSKIIGADGFGIYVEIHFSNGYHLCFNDGINARIVANEEIPKNYQMAIIFTDGTALVFSVAMYGGIFLYCGEYDNEYYIKSRQAVDIFSPEFEKYYSELRNSTKPGLSAKAFIATEQRFPGIGNGCAQDILFKAELNPRRKLGTFTENDWDSLFESIRKVLKDMIDKGGRDTEKDLHGNTGGYKVLMSKNTLATGCPVCGGNITKEAYLGGSVYYCSTCQPLPKK